MTPDHLIRQTALDTRYSFIVQAPAGSGKTELLVQRFLALLAQAERVPEEIVAITFTKKAAAEMRQRILDALHIAQQPAPEQAHARKTWELGRAALARDQQLNWYLLDNPNRLKVQTIDSFCASIVRQAPLLSGLGVYGHLLEQDADQYYLEAVRRLLNLLEQPSTAAQQLATLLLHLDNRVELLETLLVGMLKRRDQWLPHLILHGKSLSHTEFRHMLEQGLTHVVMELLTHCDQTLPLMHRTELTALIGFAAHNLGLSGLDQLPAATPDNLKYWIFLAKALLTEKSTWRIKVDKRQGFPAEEKKMKERMHILLQQLTTCEEWRKNLAALLEAPPAKYTDSQWQVIAALSELLPILVAELKVLFREKNVADFSEIAMAANAVLEDKALATDITLILDAKIRHLLVDEFQDTSTTQFRLLEKLTSEWQTGDGRSLFLVGDPMQSIYRFREAEVGLFLKAQREGLGTVKLKPLVLQANFRSTPQLVNWINTQFAAIFPAISDISVGAVTFAPSMAIKVVDAASGPCLETFLPNEASIAVAKIVTLVQQKQQAYPEENIAILVRSRAHLKFIVAELKKANVAFNAVEIDALYQQSMVQDLLALTGALLHIGDRLSWLAVLRAPWCGLTLKDLHTIAQKGLKKPLWEVLDILVASTELTKDGGQRLSKLLQVFKHSFAQRGRLAFRVWVEKTWLELNGPACLSNDAELSSAAAYFKLLDTFDEAGEVPDINTLQQMVAKQYAAPPAAANNRLHIMTIHKAKGLEFDTVIIPYLELRSRGDSDQLLLWSDRPRAGAVNDLILAPIKAKQQKEDAIYTWLRSIEKTKAHHELARLLYVAVTRAKKNLYLMATITPQDNGFEKPDTWSFLGLLWPCFEKISQDKHTNLTVVQDEHSQLVRAPVLLKRLKFDNDQQAVPQSLLGNFNPTLSQLQLQWVDQTAKSIGTIIHKILEQMGREGLTLWTGSKIAQEKPRWKMWLIQAGVSGALLVEGLAKIEQAICHTLNDSRGRWILQHHLEHSSEYALTAIVDNSPSHFVIDRTFVDAQHRRWIIDYKTTQITQEQDKDDFLIQAKTMHKEQLEQYATIMREYDPKPICLGIYFPFWGGWCEWNFNG